MIRKLLLVSLVLALLVGSTVMAQDDEIVVRLMAKLYLVRCLA